MATLQDARIDPDEAIQLSGTTLDVKVINIFIRTAHRLVDRELQDQPEVADSELADIELFLAAHFLSLRDRRTSEISVEGNRFVWEGDSGLGLDNTQWGQNAKALDSSGRLEEMDDPDKFEADVGVAGVDPSSRYE